jgi:hypothetical protein
VSTILERLAGLSSSKLVGSASAEVVVDDICGVHNWKRSREQPQSRGISLIGSVTLNYPNDEVLPVLGRHLALRGTYRGTR